METIAARAATQPKKKSEKKSAAAAYCPVRDVLHHLSDKWSMLVIRELGTQPVLRFNELKGAVPGISQKMLTTTMRKLEQNGMVRRTVFPQIPPRVEYALTPLGHEFHGHLTKLMQWACNNSAQIVGSRARK
ncbi:helix-turn-helix domain-containing protein [Flaviaesturariibacter amylovorans]|uniref:Helix-turn-helix domain-containing protein n=1 Tax=Flaviaesturariibacter amylovorans TaxID=1084520 RepID=A0ABP8HPA5_9BACT